MNIKSSLYNNFVRYVKIDTAANPEKSSQTPSSTGQMVLAKILAKELKDIGLKNIILTKHAYVIAELPANTNKKMPAVAFIAHMDTSPDYSGKNVNPVLHKKYKGGKIVLNAKKGIVIDPAKDPLLKICKGHDIVTADGSTLLGGDDKAGAAIIMTLVEYLKNNPEIKHGPVKVVFTPDEEIGHGAELLPLDKLNADFAYTIDGSVDTVDCGNFNADAATVTLTGVAVHPGYAKNVLINPLLLASEIITMWPKNKRAETTEKEQGFIHFFHIDSSEEKAVLKAIVRDHDLKKLLKLEKELEAIAAKVQKKYPGSKIEVKFEESYRNMKDILKKNPMAMKVLTKALKEARVKCKFIQVRGGTDGARLSFRGLPTPNIMAGVSGMHGPFEWVSLDVMENVVKVCANIVKER